jgi:hypothetical protein
MMATQNSCVIYSAVAPFFQLPDGIFGHSEGRMRGFSAVCGGIHVEKYSLAMYIKTGICAKKQINNIFWKGKRQ